MGDACPSAGNPIDAGTQNKFQRERDLTVGDLKFERWYNSSVHLQTASTARMGRQWSHTFAREVVLVGPKEARVRRDDGRNIFFELSSTGTWETSKLDAGRLTWVRDTLGNVVSFTYSTAAGVESYSAAGRLDSITLRGGRVVHLTYDGAGRVAAVEDAGGHALGLAYDADGRIESVTSSDGRVVSYGYDVAGHLIRATYPGAVSRSYLYDSAESPDGLTGIIDERGIRVATFDYGQNGKAWRTQHAGGADLVTLVTYAAPVGEPTPPPVLEYSGGPNVYHQWATPSFRRPLLASTSVSLGSVGFTTSKTYDAWGGISTHSDPRGFQTTYSVDDLGRPLNVTEASGKAEARTLTSTWDTGGDRLSSSQNAKTKITRTYDGNGDLATFAVSDVSAPSTSAAVSFARVDGLVTAIDGPRTDVADISTLTYDSSGAVATVANALGHTVTFLERDAAGRPLRVRDPNGLVGTMSYGPRGEPTSLDAGEGVTVHTYDAALNLVGTTHPSTGATTYSYDANSRLTLVTTPQGWSKRFTYDGASRVIKEENLDALGAVVRSITVARDGFGRPVSFTGASSTDKVVLKYDLAGNLTEIRSGLIDYYGENAVVAKYTLDGLERVTALTDAKGNVTRLTYDVNDRLASRVDARGHVTSYTYDGLGRATSVVTPDSGTVTKTYDAAGNAKVMTDAVGRTSTRSYDALGRITSIAYGGGKQETFAYDQGANALGQLTTATAIEGNTLGWIYDGHGRVAGVMHTAGGSTRSASLSRDAYGRPSSYTLPSGARVSLTYDATGSVTQLSVNDVPMITDVTYGPFVGVTGFRWANGRVVSRPRDANGRVSGYTLGSDSYNLTYDGAGRITAINGVAARTFTYDTANRLTAATGPEGSRAYTYDPTGNRASANTLPAIVMNTANDRIATIGSGGSKRTFKYAADGSVTEDGVHTYQYDVTGRLTSLDGGVWRYGYDALGRRAIKSKSVSGPTSYAPGDVNLDGFIDQRDLTLVAQMISGQVAKVAQADCNGDKKYTSADVTCVEGRARTDTVLFFYDAAGTLVGEYDGLGTAIREYVYFDGAPALVLKGGTAYFIDVDHIGTPRVVSDGLGRAVWTWQSAPFGDTAANENPSGLGVFAMPIRFSGQVRDAESGLFYNVQRYYDPAIGRYLQPDPLGLRGGDNAYEYVKSDPMRATDPLGAAPVYAGGMGTVRYVDALNEGTPTIFAAGIIHPLGSEKLASKLDVVRRILDDQGGNGSEFFYVPNGGSLPSDLWDAMTNRGDADSVQMMHNLLKIAADKKKCVDVIAHSNGNAVVADALQQLLEEGYESPIRNYTGMGPNASFESLEFLAHNTVSPFVIVNSRDVALALPGDYASPLVESGELPGVRLSWGLSDGRVLTHDMLTNYLEAARVVKKPFHQGSYSGRCGCAK